MIRPWLFPVWCVGCGTMEVALCARCTAAVVRAHLVTAGLTVTAAAAYDGHVRTAVLAMKRGERAFLEPLAVLLAAIVPARATLVPVTTTRRRAAERGYDQARELARRAARASAQPVVDVLLKHGRPQRGGSRSDRLAAAGRFTLRREAALPASALLVDDVVTTGATLADAAATLERAGVRVTGAVVVAHAPLRETSGGGRESHEA